MAGISPYSPRKPKPGLLARLEARLDRSAGPSSCWPVSGAASTSGRRAVAYPHLAEAGASGPFWRVNRLVLLLEELPEEAFEGGEEGFLGWLRLADLARKGLEASHTCDQSWCGNPRHLEWQDHTTNVQEQAQRRRACGARSGGAS